MNSDSQGQQSPPPPASPPPPSPIDTTESLALRINSRTIEVGRQVYSLNNIVRVRVHQLPFPPGHNQGNSNLGCLTAVVIFSVSLVLTVAISQLSEGLGSAVLFIGLLAAGAGFMYVLHKTKVVHDPLFALYLDTSGHPQAVVGSSDYPLIESLRISIAAALENPPEQAIVINLPPADIIMGDQINQFGQINHGIIKGDVHLG